MRVLGLSKAAGFMVMDAGLKPSRFGKRVRSERAKRSVTDGPFTVAEQASWEKMTGQER